MSVSVPPENINPVIALQYKFLRKFYKKGKANQNFWISLMTIHI